MKNFLPQQKANNKRIRNVSSPSLLFSVFSYQPACNIITVTDFHLPPEEWTNWASSSSTREIVLNSGDCLQLRCMRRPWCYLFSLSGWHLIIEPLLVSRSDHQHQHQPDTRAITGIWFPQFGVLRSNSYKNGKTQNQRKLLDFLWWQLQVYI